jgi:hypothetical protein
MSPHTHTYRGPDKNRHKCKNCSIDPDNLMPVLFKAKAAKLPKQFELKDLYVYSVRLKTRDTDKFKDLMPVLMGEGRRPMKKFKTKGN